MTDHVTIKPLNSPHPFFQDFAGRQFKSALLLFFLWGITIALHFLPWGDAMVWGVAGIVFFHLFRLITAKPLDPPAPVDDRVELPKVSLLVSAKNESAVIANLVEMLCNVDYPVDRYEVWMINDGSDDDTGNILDSLKPRYSQLKVLHRIPNAGGGKSGALNKAFQQSMGDIIAVFDADATVTPNLIKEVIAYFENPKIGAIQVRKSIENPNINFLTHGQSIEMILDGYFQQQRISQGGVGELRGNGQFVRKTALESCGGWNEETITDDLDLTFRLHLDQWEIGFLMQPPVGEEAVIKTIGLWHQRNRWAEGGYQRYLDYWRFLSFSRLGWKKYLDGLVFLVLQYLLPTTAIPDFILSVAHHRLPIFSPLTTLMIGFSFYGMLEGLKRLNTSDKQSFITRFSASVSAIVYMLHWLVIMPCVTTRMAFQEKRLKWVKTVHQG